MENILHITGLETSNKIGGLEKWFIEYSKKVNKNSNHKVFLFYEREKPIKLIEEMFFKYNIEVIVFPFNFSIENVFKFYKFLKENKISVVHCHFENTKWFLTIAKLRGLKTYWHLLMGNYYAVNLNWKKSLKLKIGVYYYKFKIFFLQFFINKIYCASNGVLNEYKSFYGFFSRKIEVNYLGMSLKQLAENKSKINGRIQDDRKIKIGCIAFHGKVKGVDVLIKTIGLLNDRGYEVELIQIGGGQFLNNSDDTQFLKDLAIKENVDNILWMGIQNDVFKFLLEFDIYCQPSRHEALSFSIMEAMSLGLPIVASNTCGIPEIIKNNVNGLLFEVEDSIGCANSIEQLINDKNLRNKMGKKSLEIINFSKFSTEENLNRLLKNYIL